MSLVYNSNNPLKAIVTSPVVIYFLKDTVYSLQGYRILQFGTYIDNMDIGLANLSILFSFSSYAVINDYISLHNLSMLLTYIVTLYHLKTASDCTTMDVVSFLM